MLEFLQARLFIVVKNRYVPVDLANVWKRKTGGTMNNVSTGQTIRSHAAGVVLYRLIQPNQLEIAAMHYHKYGQTTLRVFMGKQGEDPETHRLETFNETTEREFKAEAVSLRIPFKYEVEITPFVYWELTQDDEDKRLHGVRPVGECELLHFKGFRAFRLVEGKLREGRMTEHEGTPKEEILDEPGWYDPRGLWHKMDDVRGASPFVHKKAVAGTLHRLSKLPLYAALGCSCEDILRKTEKIVQVIPAHALLVRAYLESLEEQIPLNNGH